MRICFLHTVAGFLLACSSFWWLLSSFRSDLVTLSLMLVLWSVGVRLFLQQADFGLFKTGNLICGCNFPLGFGFWYAVCNLHLSRDGK